MLGYGGLSLQSDLLAPTSVFSPSTASQFTVQNTVNSTPECTILMDKIKQISHSQAIPLVASGCAIVHHQTESPPHHFKRWF